MEVDIEKLKTEITESGLTGEELAKAISIDPSTYYRKLKSGGGTFNLREVFKIANVLDLSPEKAKAIFLSDNSRLRKFDEHGAEGSDKPT